MTRDSHCVWHLFCRCVSECVCAFGLIYRNKEHCNEKLLSFMLDAVDIRKEELLTSLCKTIANALCRTDFVSPTVLGKQSVLVSCLFEVFLYFFLFFLPCLFCLFFFNLQFFTISFILILCHDSHSHLVLLYSSVYDGHSHLLLCSSVHDTVS